MPAGFPLAPFPGQQQSERDVSVAEGRVDDKDLSLLQELPERPFAKKRRYSQRAVLIVQRRTRGRHDFRSVTARHPTKLPDPRDLTVRSPQGAQDTGRTGVMVDSFRDVKDLNYTDESSSRSAAPHVLDAQFWKKGQR